MHRSKHLHELYIAIANAEFFVIKSGILCSNCLFRIVYLSHVPIFGSLLVVKEPMHSGWYVYGRVCASVLLAWGRDN